MDVNDMIMISIDDHVVEPPDMFTNHVPEKYRDDAPKSIADENGYEKWWFQGNSMGTIGLNAVVGWPNEEWGLNPATFAEMRPGAYDIHARIEDMNRNGILASMCFPSFAGFSARYFQEAKDKDLALIMLKAYNDWHIDEWCTAYPGRMIPCAILPVWDPVALVDEVKRVAAKGVKAVTMPELPHIQGLPSYHDLEYWGPFFQSHLRAGGRDVPAHRPGLRRDQRRPGRADRQHDHPGHPGVDVRRAGPAVGRRDAHVPRPEDRLVGGRHRLDPVLPGPLRPALHQPAVARARLRRQAPQRHLPGALAGLLRHRPDGAEGPPRHRRGHHRVGVRLPPLGLDLAQRAGVRARGDGRRPASPTTRCTRSCGRTPPGSSASTRSRTSPRRTPRSAPCAR